jgi:hypothetical protein
MPNWCSNSIILTGSAEELENFKNAVKGTEEADGKFLSFQSILPRPKALDITSGSDTDTSHGYYKFVKYNDNKFLDFYRGLSWVTANDFQNDTEMAEWLAQRSGKSLQEAYELGKIVEDNINTYGASTWYDWNISNWGTKWDADSDTPWEYINDGELFLFFETAWSPPIPIYDKIAELFPDLDFVATYAEGGCEFVGKVEKKGEYLGHNEVDWDSDEGKEIATDLGQRWDDDDEEYDEDEE